MSSQQKWTETEEGRIVLLLRELSGAELPEEKRKAIAQELARLTRQAWGDDIKRWVAWYISEHLGWSRWLGDDASAVVDSPSRPEELVFSKAEYNWCALEKIKNKDDMLKLRQIYDDLESPIKVDSSGPFNFRRLTNLDAEDLAYFRGKSLTQAMFDEKVQVRHLRALKDYGKMMLLPAFPSGTQRTGAVLYASSICQALVKLDAKITSLSYQDIKESLPGLLERPYIVESFIKLFQAALEKCH